MSYEAPQIRPDPDAELAAFIGPGLAFYRRAFKLSQEEGRRLPPFHPVAALLGSFWLGARRIQGWFWLFLTLELVGAVLIVLALSTAPNREAEARVTSLTELAGKRASEAAEARARDPDGAMTASIERSAQSLAKAAEDARLALETQGPATGKLLSGLAVLIVPRLLLGYAAVPLVAGRLRQARMSGRLESHGFSWGSVIFTFLVWLVIMSLTLIHYAGALPGSLFDAGGVPDLASRASSAIDIWLRGVSGTLAPAARQISWAVETLLGGLEYALIATPWPVVAIVILAFAAQRGGWKLAIGVLIGLGYLLAFGYWERAMQTVALLGTASLIAVVIGIPLGIWSGYNRRVAAVVRPVLDFMQTTPAFVYLIPVIALFGIGKTAGIVATVIFGVAPVIRQTTFGIASVPPEVREAALSFGAGRWFMLRKIDLPIAGPAIMAGISQTVLMSLSMVVIAALIGARGLGEEVLSALQYAAQGKGILAGLAILICAIVIDRIIQSQRKT